MFELPSPKGGGETMLQCACCGARWEAPSYFRQSRGECFGFPAYEESAGCPRCGGSLELREREEIFEEVDVNE